MSDYLAKRNMPRLPKGSVVPNRDPAAWQHASVVARARRKEVLQRLKVRDLSVAELRTMLDDKYLRKLRAIDVVAARKGRSSGWYLLEELGIRPDKPIGTLGPAQWHNLIGRCDDRPS
jgi:hypothetical protein